MTLPGLCCYRSTAIAHVQEAKDEKNKGKNRTPLKSMTAADKQEQADAFKKQGNEAFKAGKYQDAAALFSAALELTPRNAVRLFYL